MVGYPYHSAYHYLFYFESIGGSRQNHAGQNDKGEADGPNNHFHQASRRLGNEKTPMERSECGAVVWLKNLRSSSQAGDGGEAN